MEVTADGAHLRLKRRVQTAVLLAGGDLLLGLGEPHQVASWKAGGNRLELYDLPCTPVAGARLGAETHLLCRAPFGTVTISPEQVPTSLTSFRTGEIGGEPLDCLRSFASLPLHML